jgi:hypothetical protein
MYIQKLRELVPSLSENTVGACNQITLLILHAVISRFVTLLKVTDIPLTLAYSHEIFVYGFK